VLAALVGRDNYPEPYSLFISVDGGCHWSDRGRIDASRLVEGKSGVAYAWGRRVYEVTVEGVRNLGGPLWLDALTVDPHDEKHLRGVGADGVFDCASASVKWKRVSTFGEVYGGRLVTFDPTDLNHMVVGGKGRIVATRNGGRTWASLGAPDTPHSRGGLVFTSHEDLWFFGSTILRSKNGGTLFARVATPIPDEFGYGLEHVVFLGAQSDPDAILLTGIEPRGRRLLLRFNLRSLDWTKEVLELRHRDADVIEEFVTAGTSVPGETSAVCLGIVLPKPQFDDIRDLSTPLIPELIPWTDTDVRNRP
jgi:hypothetical protein